MRYEKDIRVGEGSYLKVFLLKPITQSTWNYFDIPTIICFIWKLIWIIWKLIIHSTFLVAYPLFDFLYIYPSNTFSTFILFSILYTYPNHWRKFSSSPSSTPFSTTCNSVFVVFSILSILPISNKLLRLSIYKTLTPELSFHTFISLPYIKTGPHTAPLLTQVAYP